MKTIVVPLDGSPLAEQVLPAVQVLASLLHARIHLLRAVPDDELETVEAERAALYVYGGPLALTLQRERAAVDQAHRHAEAYLEGHALHLQQRGFPTTTEVFGGEPAALIVECAQAKGAALIALTTHGYSGIRRWALGSVASKVVQATHVSVFLARSDGQAITSAHALRRVLVPLDGSTLARAALPVALNLARLAGTEVVLFHAVAPPAWHAATRPYGDLLAFERDRHLEVVRSFQALATELDAQDVAIRPLVTVGDAADAIARAAVWEQADLIVMATHGRSGVQRWALGSVADKLLHASTVPLLLVRPEPT